MGAGASTPDLVDLSTAKQLAGGFFDADEFNASAGEGGLVTKDQFLAAAARCRLRASTLGLGAMLSEGPLSGPRIDLFQDPNPWVPQTNGGWRTLAVNFMSGGKAEVTVPPTMTVFALKAARHWGGYNIA